MRIENPPPAGDVVFLLFDSADGFGDFRDPVKSVRLPIDGYGIYRVDDVPPGEYALIVHYDENGNGIIDKNFIGIPKEPLGFSNSYNPKGPPRYKSAVFVLEKGKTRHFDVQLRRPLGTHGRFGLGAGVIARSSPYRDYDGGVYKIIPAISYTGQRLQLYGPRVQFGLAGSGALRLAATGQYRMGVYEDDKSDYLAGMGDAKDTIMAGLSLQAELPAGLNAKASYAHDVLDEIGGGEARLEIERAFQFGNASISPLAALNWTGSDLANNDFGVPADRQTPIRPAYSLDDVVSAEVGARCSIEMSRDWLFAVNAAIEYFDDEAAESPIMSEDYVIKGFAVISYLF